MIGCISGTTFEGLATTLFGHSTPVRELVWSLQAKGDSVTIGWEEFISFAEKEDHIPVRVRCQSFVFVLTVFTNRSDVADCSVTQRTGSESWR